MSALSAGLGVFGHLGDVQMGASAFRFASGWALVFKHSIGFCLGYPSHFVRFRLNGDP